MLAIGAYNQHVPFGGTSRRSPARSLRCAAIWPLLSKTGCRSDGPIPEHSGGDSYPGFGPVSFSFERSISSKRPSRADPPACSDVPPACVDVTPACSDGLPLPSDVPPACSSPDAPACSCLTLFDSFLSLLGRSVDFEPTERLPRSRPWALCFFAAASPRSVVASPSSLPGAPAFALDTSTEMCSETLAQATLAEPALGSSVSTKGRSA
eukprot:1423130-Prymnesium_polylepis.2